MINFICLLIASVAFSTQNIRGANYAVNSPKNIDSLIDQSAIDEAWINYMIKAPATINFLGRIMIVGSMIDFSLESFSTDHVFKYIKNPKSFHSTLSQISNECYRTFHDAHTTMAKIQVYMKQILRYMENISKITSKGSVKIISRVVPNLVKNIERIANTCVVLGHSADDSFISVINLLGEFIEISAATASKFQRDKRSDEIALKITYDDHADRKRREEEESIQIINIVSRFGESLNSLIKTLSKNDKRNDKELQSYKVVFKAYDKLVNTIPHNKLTVRVMSLIQRAITLVDVAINDPKAIINDKLKALANDVKPFTVAQQLSSTNNAPINVSADSDSLDNELLKARIAQQRLSQMEQRFDAQHAQYSKMLEHIRTLTEKLSRLNLTEVRFIEIVEMFKEELKLFRDLKKNWNDLILSFSSFSDQITTGFNLKLESFFGTGDSTLDGKESPTDRKLILQLIKDDLDELYHESNVLFILSRTYNDVSNKYLIPRVSRLSNMLSNSNNNERQQLLTKLHQDTQEVQNEIKKFINQRRKKYKKVTSKKRAKTNEMIDNQGA